MRKPPCMLGLKKFGPGKIWIENVATQNTCILAFMHTFVLIWSKKFFRVKFFLGSNKVFQVKTNFGSTKFFGSKKVFLVIKVFWGQKVFWSINVFFSVKKVFRVKNTQTQNWKIILGSSLFNFSRRAIREADRQNIPFDFLA